MDAARYKEENDRLRETEGPTVTPPALPHVPSYLACPAYAADLLTPSLVGLGSAGVGIRRSSQGSPAADIPPLRLVRILTTMPLFLAVIRAKWAICRAGQGSAKRPRFTPKTRPKQQKPRSGFSVFRNTGRRSVPAVSVPPALPRIALAKDSASAAAGIFSAKTPSGFSSFQRREKALAAVPSGRLVVNPCPAAQRGPGLFSAATLRRVADVTEVIAPSALVWPPATRRRASHPAWIETLRYATRNPELKGGTPRRT